MGYQRGATAQAPVVAVEQARRRNAELRRELAALTAENNALEAERKSLDDQVATARLRVSEARRLLTRKVRDLDAIRAQMARLTTAQVSTFPEPVYGGREGLEAATKELEAHEAKGVPPRPDRRAKGHRHGTSGRYSMGCRCDDCVAWRKRKSDRSLAAYHARRALKDVA